MIFRCRDGVLFFFFHPTFIVHFSEMNKVELENRLIDFSVMAHQICCKVNKSDLGKYLSQQLIRSAISPALNYGEAQGAESQKDFIHKLRISLKELRESHISLRIVKRTDLYTSVDILDKAIDECNQLISIFVSSIKTAQKSI